MPTAQFLSQRNRKNNLMILEGLVTRQLSEPCSTTSTFFKLASDVSGGELLKLEYIKSPN